MKGSPHHPTPTNKSVLTHCQLPKALIKVNVYIIGKIFNTPLMAFPILLCDNVEIAKGIDFLSCETKIRAGERLRGLRIRGLV